MNKVFLFPITFLLLNLFTFTCSASELDHIIGPEIYNDAFYHEIYSLARNQNIHTILEIGSSNGEGSTHAFVSGILENPNSPTLYCMEVSQPRFAALKKHYENNPFVRCYNVSSVPISEFPSEVEVANFYQTILTNLNGFPLERVLGWLKQDIEYIASHQVYQNGIELIKQENGIKIFDMVLIDGSEFSGQAELKHVYGAKFILLDDIVAFKNYRNYVDLLNDPAYTLVSQNLVLRNGYAVFKRND